MKISEAVKEALRLGGRSYADVCEGLGYETAYPRQFVSKKLNTVKRVDVAVAVAALRTAGYVLAAVPDGEALPAGSIVVDDEWRADE